MNDQLSSSKKIQTFSQRKGYKPVRQVLQLEGMDDTLRISLWNILDALFWRQSDFLYASRPKVAKIWNFSDSLWFIHFKQPIDQKPDSAHKIVEFIRNHFFTCQWYEVYDFLEFVVQYFKNEDYTTALNIILQDELAGYRIVSNVVTDVTNEIEIELLETTLADNEFPAVKAHLQRALELLSNKEQPDYRNSIKESISAVESLVKEITGNPKATLGNALGHIEKSGKMHPALKQALSSLYGYTSDENGIRHAMLEEPNISAAEAKFMLLSCTSFINYLKSKS